MRAMGPYARPSEPRKPQTMGGPAARFAPNRLNREFPAQRASATRVTDITVSRRLPPFCDPGHVLPHGRGINHGSRLRVSIWSLWPADGSGSSASAGSISPTVAVRLPARGSKRFWSRWGWT